MWDRWKDATGKWLETCSILTTTPNAVTTAVHDRMPVILDPDGYDLWVDPRMANAAAASDLLKASSRSLVGRHDRIYNLECSPESSERKEPK